MAGRETGYGDMDDSDGSGSGGVTRRLVLRIGAAAGVGSCTAGAGLWALRAPERRWPDPAVHRVTLVYAVPARTAESPSR
jgi:hypothetical protein